mgnify:FL=1
MKKPRRDVLKSQEAIKQAFIQLCIAHDTSKITVNQILELADVSRGTFYAHFQDVYDVRRQLEDDLLKYCLDLLQQDDIYSIAQNPYPQILKVAHFFAEHADAIKNLSRGTDSLFLQKYKEILVQALLDSKHTIDDQNTIHLLDVCIISAIVDGCYQMVAHGQLTTQNAEAIAQTISQFVSKGMNSFE